jgi:hypothetical protein
MDHGTSKIIVSEPGWSGMDVWILSERMLRPKDLQDHADLCRYNIKMYVGVKAGEGANWVQLIQGNTVGNTVSTFINA